MVLKREENAFIAGDMCDALRCMTDEIYERMGYIRHALHSLNSKYNKFEVVLELESNFKYGVYELEEVHRKLDSVRSKVGELESAFIMAQKIFPKKGDEADE